MYIFSKSTLSFYPAEMEEAYQQAGTWPDDGVDVTEEIFNEFNSTAPDGKQRGADADGYPAWVDIPQTEVDISTARQQKQAEIENWRNQQENGHYIFTFNGREWDYSKDTQDRLQLAVAMAKQDKLLPGFFWTDGHNHDIPMTGSEIIALSDAVNSAMFAKGLQIHLRQREMKTAVDKLTHARDILDYPVSWKNAIAESNDE